MTRSAEMDALRRLRRIRHPGKIGTDEIGGFDQLGRIEELAGERTDARSGHVAIRQLRPMASNNINNSDLNLQ